MFTSYSVGRSTAPSPVRPQSASPPHSLGASALLSGSFTSTSSSWAGRGYASETELESMQIVDGAVGYLRSEGVPADGVHYLANCFTIADRIAEAANGWSADVIVLGSKRRRWFSRFGGAGLRRARDEHFRTAGADRSCAVADGA